MQLCALLRCWLCSEADVWLTCEDTPVAQGWHPEQVPEHRQLGLGRPTQPLFSPMKPHCPTATCFCICLEGRNVVTLSLVFILKYAVTASALIRPVHLSLHSLAAHHLPNLSHVRSPISPNLGVRALGFGPLLSQAVSPETCLQEVPAWVFMTTSLSRRSLLHPRASERGLFCHCQSSRVLSLRQTEALGSPDSLSCPGAAQPSACALVVFG